MDGHGVSGKPSAVDRLRRYAGGGLQHRLFVWFVLAVLAAAAVAGGATWLAVRVASPDLWRNWDSLRRTLPKQFADVWDQPQQRHAVAAHLHEAFDLGFELRDRDGAMLEHFGDACDHPSRPFVILHDKRVLGYADVCVPPGPPPRFWLGLGVGALALFVFCRALARRLAQPLAEVARIAEQMGEGNLDVQVQPPRRHRGPRDEVAVVGEVLQEMAARVSKQLRDQRELLAAVSHELRTPLGHLRLMLESYRERAETGAAHLPIDEAERELQDIDDLVGQLLANARLEFRQLQLQSVDLVGLAVEALERKGIEPTLLEAEGEGHVVRGDPTLLQRALGNLLDNARKHGGGATAVRVLRQGQRVSVEVHDGGPGFGPDQIGKVFAPFYSAGHRAESLGLGLHLVAKIAAAHGGTASARNLQEHSPRGAAVSFELPAEG